MQNQKIRIRLKAFDYRLIDKSAMEIVETTQVKGEQQKDLAGNIFFDTVFS